MLNKSESPHSPLIEDEEKINGFYSQIYSHVTTIKEHLNPLLSNKGSVTGVVDLSPSNRLGLPNFSHFTKLPGRKINSSIDVVNFDNADAENSPTAMAEFKPNEKINSIDTFFQLPLFEIHHTMYVLIQKKKTIKLASPVISKPSKENIDELEKIISQENVENEVIINEPANKASPEKEEQTTNGHAKMPYKSVSMFLAKGRGVDTMAENLSPEQYAYLKKVFGFKGNYLHHSLNMREVYFQYVAVTKEMVKLSNNDKIKSQLQNLLKQTHKYPKKDKGIFIDYSNKNIGLKTLVLDLDETLVHASPTIVKGYDLTFTYIDSDSQDKKVFFHLD